MKRLIGGALLGLAAVGAASAAAAPGPPVINPTKTAAKPFLVNCTSNGLVCTPPYRFTLRLPAGRRVQAMTYVASSQHCSQVSVRVGVNGAQRRASEPLGPGASHTVSLANLAPGRDHAITVRGTGVLGGCNTGYTQAWGGTLRFIVEPFINVATTRSRAFAVTCTSSGLVCTPPYTFTLRIPSGRRVQRMTYTALATHCSDVKVNVVVNGRARTPGSGALPPGGTYDVSLSNLAGGRDHRISIRGTGVVGGCNAGLTGSWGGRLNFTVASNP